MRRPSSATSAVQACPLKYRYSWRPCGSGNHPEGIVVGSLTASQSTVARVEFVLVRHGQPEWVRDGFNVADPPLTEFGERQASLMAEALARRRSTKCSSRPCSGHVRRRRPSTVRSASPKRSTRGWRRSATPTGTAPRPSTPSELYRGVGGAADRRTVGRAHRRRADA